MAARKGKRGGEWMADSQAKFEAAHRLLKEGARDPAKYDAAVAGFEELLARQPKNMLATLYLAYALDHAGRGSEAAKNFARVIQLYRTKERMGGATDKDRSITAGALNGLAKKKSRHGKPDEAIRLYRQALELAPGNKDSVLGLGRALIRAAERSHAPEDYEAAAKQFRAARLRWPNDRRLLAESLQGEGEAHQKMGDTTRALLFFDWALTQNPRHLKTLNSSAEALLTLGRFDEARAMYERALKVVPGYLPALKGLKVIEESR